MATDKTDPLPVPGQVCGLQVSSLSEIFKALLNTDYLVQVENDVLYICHSSSEKMHWLVNDLMAALVFGQAQLLGCSYVYFHSYGRVSVAGGLTYVRNSIADHTNQLM